jgi:hypothetical protein
MMKTLTATSVSSIVAPIVAAIVLPLLAACSASPDSYEAYKEPAVCTAPVAIQPDTTGSNMRPGGACVACHDATSGPSFRIGGTVMRSQHDDENCNGASGVTVEITDAANQVISLTTNTAGNFEQRGNATVTFPIKAKVKYNGREKVMVSAQASGDCNACHTAAGTSGAPGRITVP